MYLKFKYNGISTKDNFDMNQWPKLISKTFICQNMQ